MDLANTQEMIEVIKGAGIYEDNMSKEQMKLYYEAVVNSKDTCTAENESRTFNNSPEDMFAVDLDSPMESNPNKVSGTTQLEDRDSESSVLKPKIRNYNKKITVKGHFDKVETHEDESLPQDATKACFSFDDMPKDTGSPLVIIHHPPLYINIQNSEKFISADCTTKAKMLFKYHSNMEKLRSALSRQSFFPAPQPKPIEIATSTDTFENVYNTEETYISRAGRQTKRKVYNDDEDFPTSPSNKKAKSKTMEKPKWQSKPKSTKKTEPAQESTETETIEVVQKEMPKAPTRTKKLSNAEIMSRSKLFGDSPLKRTRSEKLFDKLKEETVKKQKDEKILKAFEISLCSDIEANQSESQKEEEDMIQVFEDEFPKRVIPPIPTRRKPINSRSPQQKSNIKNPSQQKETELFLVNSSLSTADISANVQCPICLKSFSEDSVAEHASNCGEEKIMTRNVSRNRITCEICDKVIPTNYELHVSVCKKNQDKLDRERE